MSRAAISVEGLGKAYRIGLKEEIPDTLASAMASWAKMPLRNFRRLSRLNTFRENGDSEDTVWALRDVSFEVQEGEVVGVIGRNGAGKSTLLKILSRITEPTAGRAVIHGRVSSLLEVGTGFHPELSGRENIYMNGTILGMTKREIDRKFDEIVDFSGVEKFLDTPIKRYSSGMKVRLAFSVAAHLEPEILIIDEVLAVGDTEFQRKCLGKMEDVASHGRTVLFVSHNMAAVQTLCTRGILLNQGTKRVDAPVSAAVDEYLRTVENNATMDPEDREDRRGTGEIRLVRVSVTAGGDSSEGALVTGYPARFLFETDRFLPGLRLTFTIYDHRGVAVTSFDTGLTSPDDQLMDCSSPQFICDIEALPLRQGRYRINAALNRGLELVDHLEGAAVFTVEGATLFGRGACGAGRYGSVSIRHSWSLPCGA